jgi:hypothetical protein
MASPLIQQSDKFFWHGYVGFYENHLPRTIDGDIVEFGVFKGNSIRWLLERYPAARHIHGIDILPYQTSWPVDERVTYWQVDQHKDDQVRVCLQSIAPPDLIIEDGSHVPAHQSRCLKFGMTALRAGGLYVLEDIQTSLPAHPLYASEFSAPKQLVRGLRDGMSLSSIGGRIQGRKATSLSLLLAFEQIRRRGGDRLTADELAMLTGGGHFSEDEIVRLDTQIAQVAVYKRATLPSACYACGSTIFDYHNYRCQCGVGVLDEADSMTVVIQKR